MASKIETVIDVYSGALAGKYPDPEDKVEQISQPIKAEKAMVKLKSFA